MLRTTLLMLLAGAGLTVTVQADTLLLEGLEQSSTTQTLRPSRGMTMQRVEQNWGTPMRRMGPVGDPPIASWEYTDFVVYFEYDHVIHAVVRKSG